MKKSPELMNKSEKVMNNSPELMNKSEKLMNNLPELMNKSVPNHSVHTETKSSTSPISRRGLLYFCTESLSSMKC